MTKSLNSFTRRTVNVVAMTLFLTTANGAIAETLNDSLVLAYRGSPTLKAEQARQRGTDELVPQALSGWRPTIAVEGAAGFEVTDSSDTPANAEPKARLAISLSQPLFRGYKTIYGTKAARANVLAGRQNLLAVEQDIIFQTILAYMNVVRDRQVLSLRNKIVGALKQPLKGAGERQAVGEITATDIAQARSRVAGAQSEVAAAVSALAASTANYERLVGRKPGKLKSVKIPMLPKSLSQAQAAAMRINPNILAAALVEEASAFDIEVAKGDLLPELNLAASVGFEGFDCRTEECTRPA